MIGGVPFFSVEQREELMARAVVAEEILPDPTVQVLRSVPPLVLTSKDKGWQDLVQQAVHDGAMVVGPLREDPEVARFIALTSAELHGSLARRARTTVAKIDSKML